MELAAINYGNTNIESNSENGFLSMSAAHNLEYQVDSVSANQNKVQAQKDSVSSKPTLQQIRNWRWLREKKLTVGESRYMQPKEDVNVATTLKEESGLGLSMREINRVNTDWITVLLFVVVVLLATVRFAYSKYIIQLFQSLINYSTSFRMFREKNYTILHGAFRLDIVFYLSLSLFVYQVLGFIGKERVFVQTNFAFFGFTILCVLLYFLIKRIIYKVLGSIFESVNETNEYLFNMDNYNRTLGLTLIPVTALINYYPANNPVFMVFAGGFIAIVYYVFMLQRGISILLRKQFSIFYLFLYLCTLEILPLLLIYKVVVL